MARIDASLPPVPPLGQRGPYPNTDYPASPEPPPKPHGMSLEIHPERVPHATAPGRDKLGRMLTVPQGKAGKVVESPKVAAPKPSPASIALEKAVKGAAKSGASTRYVAPPTSGPALPGAIGMIPMSRPNTI